MKTASLALLSTAGLSVVLGPLIIPLLRALKFGQMVRNDGPQSHLHKAGTPTMGGLIFLLAITGVAYYFGKGSTQVILALVATVGYGLIGFADDFIKVALHRTLGLKARYKLTGEIVLGLLLGLLVINITPRGTEVLFFSYSLDLGWFYPFFALLVLVSTTNTVNLTDGLDGLAAGTMFFASTAYMLIAWWLSNIGLMIFAATMAGGCLGFLAYNRHPARVFMGDTGSLALGGALGIMAVLTRTEFLLFIIGGIYVVEALSVIIQVVFFRYTGKRFFRMSPLHHHFELSGWRETKVVGIFWAVALILAILGVVIFLVTG